MVFNGSKRQHGSKPSRAQDHCLASTQPRRQWHQPFRGHPLKATVTTPALLSHTPACRQDSHTGWKRRMIGFFYRTSQIDPGHKWERCAHNLPFARDGQRILVVDTAPIDPYQDTAVPRQILALQSFDRGWVLTTLNDQCFKTHGRPPATYCPVQTHGPGHGHRVEGPADQETSERAPILAS